MKSSDFDQKIGDFHVKVMIFEKIRLGSHYQDIENFSLQTSILVLAAFEFVSRLIPEVGRFEKFELFSARLLTLYFQSSELPMKSSDFDQKIGDFHVKIMIFEKISLGSHYQDIENCS